MSSIRIENFNLKYTVESAQPLTFFGNTNPSGDAVSYPCENDLVTVYQQKDRLSYFSNILPNTKLKNEVVTRFGLSDNLNKIYEEIGTDKFMKESISRYSGMRITQNDHWETTLCFILSQFNNVKRIRGIVKNLMNMYGEIGFHFRDGREMSFRSFPTPEAIAAQSVSSLMQCGAGFRAKYIKATAEMCADSFDLKRLRDKSYPDAKEELLELPGVGDKVADCILLMGYKKLGAFPIDTWVKRIVERTYFKGRKQSLRKIHNFAEERFGRYAGYAQQYIFWHGRSLKMIA